ncbi:MAG: histidinol dehydrogenase, partial [Anaerolineales bacterium]|nr:histidinol dehydrogenase [Anaerolineales bacterium]
MIPTIIGKDAGREKILRQRGMLGGEISPALLERLQKTFGDALTPEQAVARIIADVCARGDAALRDWTRQLDGVTLSSVAVSQDEIDAAYAETPATMRDALELAATRVRAFHEKQKPKSWLSGRGEAFARLNPEFNRDFQFKEDANASIDLANASPLLGQHIIPLSRVGV